MDKQQIFFLNHKYKVAIIKLKGNIVERASYDSTSFSSLLPNTEYIAAFIQGLYKGVRVHPTGLAVNQGCRQVSTICL